MPIFAPLLALILKKNFLSFESFFVRIMAMLHSLNCEGASDPELGLNYERLVIECLMWVLT